MAEILLTGKELIESKSNGSKDFPTIGNREYKPENSWLEKKQIQSYLEEKHSILSSERIEKLANLAKAEWLSEEQKAKVSKKVGKNWEVFGHCKNNAEWLLPEEALFLLEINVLRLFYCDIPVSIEQGYFLVLGKNCTLEEYRVFSFLCKRGYKVLRHRKENNVTMKENQAVVEVQRTKKPMKRSELEPNKNRNIVDIDENSKDISIVEHSTTKNSKTEEFKRTDRPEDTVVTEDLYVVEDEIEVIEIDDVDYSVISKNPAKRTDFISIEESEDEDSDNNDNDSIIFISDVLNPNKETRNWFIHVSQFLVPSTIELIDLSDENGSPNVKEEVNGFHDYFELTEKSRYEIMKSMPSVVNGVTTIRAPDNKFLPSNIEPKFALYRVNLNKRDGTEDNDDFSDQYRKYQRSQPLNRWRQDRQKGFGNRINNYKHSNTNPRNVTGNQSPNYNQNMIYAGNSSYTSNSNNYIPSSSHFIPNNNNYTASNNYMTRNSNYIPSSSHYSANNSNYIPSSSHYSANNSNYTASNSNSIARNAGRSNYVARNTGNNNNTDHSNYSSSNLGNGVASSHYNNYNSIYNGQISLMDYINRSIFGNQFQRRNNSTSLQMQACELQMMAIGMMQTASSLLAAFDNNHGLPRSNLNNSISNILAPYNRNQMALHNLMSLNPRNQNQHFSDQSQQFLASQSQSQYTFPNNNYNNYPRSYQRFSRGRGYSSNNNNNNNFRKRIGPRLRYFNSSVKDNNTPRETVQSLPDVIVVDSDDDNNRDTKLNLKRINAAEDKIPEKKQRLNDPIIEISDFEDSKDDLIDLTSLNSLPSKLMSDIKPEAASESERKALQKFIGDKTNLIKHKKPSSNSNKIKKKKKKVTKKELNWKRSKLDSSPLINTKNTADVNKEHEDPKAESHVHKESENSHDRDLITTLYVDLKKKTEDATNKKKVTIECTSKRILMSPRTGEDVSKEDNKFHLEGRITSDEDVDDVPSTWAQIKLQRNENIEDVDPLIQPLSDSNELHSIGSIYAALQIFEPITLSPLRTQLKISFDVYLPTDHFKKSVKTLPKFRIVVTSGGDAIPTKFDLDNLKLMYQDNVPILYAVVLEESVGFYTYDPVCLPQFF